MAEISNDDFARRKRRGLVLLPLAELLRTMKGEAARPDPVPPARVATRPPARP